ncbi:MAG: dihydropteroate synthase [Pirellulales bacterium]|nr:dihydropteroate synthase [Pirellulales bacterium]
MGIVNVTPDSFSDSGRYLDADKAITHGMQLAAEGADILDVGGESTRPGAAPIDAREELRRVMPVLEALCEKTDLPVSIDTSKALVAKSAIDAGAEIINDVTALEGDPDMLPLAVESGCGVCLMHKRGSPRTMQDEPVYADVVAEVFEYLRIRRDTLLAAGVSQDRIAVDPGIGFGKTTRHNIQLLANIGRLHDLDCLVLVGHSRKRFLAGLSATGSASAGPGGTGNMPAPPPADRLPGTIGVAMSLARQGAQILRVHDVAAVRQALLLFRATGGFQ